MSQAAFGEAFPSKGQAGADPASIPLEKIDVTDSELWVTDSHWGYFERLRNEAPVHYCADSVFGPYWSVTKFDDIVEVEKDPETYSSEPTITVGDIPEDSVTQNAGFITMDGPRHSAHRKVAQPVSSPRNLKALEPIVRERSIAILDSLPIGETFDWVDKVSIELTTAMLATMFDFDWETRRKLTYWSDMATISDEQLAEEGLTDKDRENAMLECLQAFTEMWNARRGQKKDTLDFVSALANSDATSDIDPAVDPVTYLGTLMLLGSSSHAIMRDWNGVDFHAPLGHVRESVEIIRAALSGEKTDYQGTYFRSKGLRLGSIPERPMRIYLAALREKMLRLAGAAGEGLIINFQPLGAMPQILEAYRAGAKEAGRDATDDEVVCRFQVCVTDDKEKARAIVRMAFGGYLSAPVYNKFLAWCGHEEEARAIAEGFATRDRAAVAAAMHDELVDSIAILGTPDECREQLAAFVAAGVTTPVLSPSCDESPSGSGCFRNVRAVCGLSGGAR